MPNQVLDKITLRRNNIDESYFISNSVHGYLNETDGKFYKESTYTTEIEGIVRLVYIDLSTDKLYRYDSADTEYVQIGGSGTGGIEYVNTLPTSNIEDTIYGIVSRVSYTATVDADFLDDAPAFEKTTSGDDYTYTAAEGYELEASTDDVTYKGFISLSYDNTASEFTLTYDDATTATLVATDTFYYKVVSRNFYAGNKTEQIIIPLASGGGGGGASYIPGEGIDITNNIISTSPATTSTLGGVKPDDKTLKVDSNGVLSGNYQGGYGIKISNDNEIETKTFVGTQAEWDGLTSAQKAKFDTVSITDDSVGLNTTPGHAILDESGTSFPQRTNLQFEDMTVTDDSTNDVTKVAPIPYTAGRAIDIDTNKEIAVEDTVKTTFVGTTTEWEALSATDKAKYEIVNLTDDVSNPTIVVDTVADGNMNAVSSNAVYDAVSKVETQTFDSNFKITRCGRLRTLTVNGRTTTVSSGSITGLGNTLPEKDWPAMDYVIAVGNCRGSDSKYLPMYITLHNNNFTGFALDATITSGYRYMTGTPDLWFSMTYIAKE